VALRGGVLQRLRLLWEIVMKGYASWAKWFVIGVSTVLVVSSALFCRVMTRVDDAAVPTPSFPLEDLLLGMSAFPEGWYLPTGQPIDPPGGFGVRTALTFSPPGSGAIALHEVSVARNPDEAAAGYEEWGEFWFSNREGYCMWAAPSEFTYQSPVADQYRLACCIRQQEGGDQTCQAVGQYGRYLIRFRTYMNPESMTFADLERILIAIDERMALYLEKDTY
jgi:hypothetical protein